MNTPSLREFNPVFFFRLNRQSGGTASSTALLMLLIALMLIALMLIALMLIALMLIALLLTALLLIALMLTALLLTALLTGFVQIQRPHLPHGHALR